ncbi:MAG: ABC transporter substrate-binding protein [Acidobacteria bacterium]|nr:ABC transporter substrate-binding protein [Acidobacteriota bacterium]
MTRFISITLLVISSALGCAEAGRDRIVVGSKNFTESVILGELVAQTLEAYGCAVDRRLNMGGTFVANSALRSGDLDAYPEYSGTALTAILDHEPVMDREEVRRIITEAFERSGIEWSPDLGFENTFAMLVRAEDAEKHSLRTISDLVRVQESFRPGFGYEFADRADGWPGLLEAYGLEFSTAPRTMDLGLTYRALESGEVDLIAGNSTDGLIDKLGLVMLEDDREYFPPYDAAIAYRADIDGKCSGASGALDGLGGAIDESEMRRMNHAVDAEGRTPPQVVRELRDRLE